MLSILTDRELEAGRLSNLTKGSMSLKQNSQLSLSLMPFFVATMCYCSLNSEIEVMSALWGYEFAKVRRKDPEKG